MDPRKNLPFKSYDVKTPNMQTELYVAQREPFSRSFGTNSYNVKGNWSVECCFRGGYWCNQRETSEIAAKTGKSLVGASALVRACAVYIQACLSVYMC